MFVSRVKYLCLGLPEHPVPMTPEWLKRIFDESGLDYLAEICYGAPLHETRHWTGTPQHLNREILNNSQGFGNIQYAKEELRAELARVFLMAARGISHNSVGHDACPDS
jgi:hypothetical protein